MTTNFSTRVASKVITGTAFSALMMTLFGVVRLALGLESMRTDSPWLIAAGARGTCGADLNLSCGQKTSPVASGQGRRFRRGIRQA